jgi:hypothetical protein
MDQELTEELEVQLLIKMKNLFKEQLFFSTQNNKEISILQNYLDIPKYINNIDSIQNYLQLVEEQIKLKCKHNYVTDDIDIDPEKSMRICYCTICEMCCDPVDSS